MPGNRPKSPTQAAGNGSLRFQRDSLQASPLASRTVEDRTAERMGMRTWREVWLDTSRPWGDAPLAPWEGFAV